MRCFPYVLLALVVLMTTGREAAGGEPDAAALAALIDEQIEARLTSEGVPAAARADDAEFLRRVTLDLHGVIPTLEEANRFLADSHPDRRSRLVESLLASPRYGQYMADTWTGYLVSPLSDDRPSRGERFRQWLAEQFNTKSWDRISSALLTASGRMEENPGVIYLIEGRLPRSVPDLTDLTSRYFLGIRLSCAQCHDHPFVNWTQQDYWGMAAFFAQVQTPGRAKQVYRLGVVDDRRLTLAGLPDAGAIDGYMPRGPTFLGGREMPPGGDVASRAVLAGWMTSPENPYFARAMVNRTWWRLFGRGIVQPVDDMHEANPPSHPRLLDLLAERFIASGFDLKFLTRAIVLSRAYQRTSRTDGSAAAIAARQGALFGRMSIKVLSAGQLHDSLEAIFGPVRVKGRADARHIARSEFVGAFDDGSDPDPTEYRRGIAHVLRQMNSPQFAARNPDALLTRLAATERPPEEIASDLFLTILTRRPTADEQRRFESYLRTAGSARDGCRELAWVLLMSSEFSLNH